VCQQRNIIEDLLKRSLEIEGKPPVARYVLRQYVTAGKPRRFSRASQGSAKNQHKKVPGLDAPALRNL
jgi:hypothetical protein